MTMSVQCEKLEESLSEAISYLLGKKWDAKISFETLFLIRNYLQKEMTEEIYKSKFERTYEYDKSIDRVNYGNDGCTYNGNIQCGFIRIEKYLLYGEKENWRPIDPNIECNCCGFKKVRGKEWYKYCYFNEIDHFFSYWIIRYLRMSEGKNYKNSIIKDNAVKTLMWEDIGMQECECKSINE